MGHNSSKSGHYPASRQVQTKYGPIEGRRILHEGDKQVDAFQGIPYAQPPVGELRFALPQEPIPWTEIKETKNFGNRGIQKDNMFQSYNIPKSEDNLTLNVFTPVWPSKDEEGFAVLVFIHGGGFVSDSAVKYGDIHIGEYLVRKDLVVVTLQYRLGYLGFWTTGDGVCPENLALHDQTLALKWVQENIKAFNGNPNNVTIMGQSAGGDMVDLLSLSPVSRDLFHKVIPMAGNSSCDWAIMKDTVTSCKQKAKEFGIYDDSDSKTYLDKLRAVPADKFGVDMQIPDPLDKSSTLPIGPKYDKVFLPKPLDELRKEAPPKPRIIGLARHEGLIMKLATMSITNKKPPLADIMDHIGCILSEEKFPVNSREVQRKILKKLSVENASKDELTRALTEVLGDMFMNIGTQKNVIDNLKLGAEVYFYSFDYYNPKAYGKLGWLMPFTDSTHCTDISYVVGTHIVGAFEFTEVDWRMVDITTTFWSNFCKYGNPNARTEDEKKLVGEVVWEPSSLENPQKHLSINLKPEMKSEFRDGRPKLYLELLEDYQEPRLIF